MEDHAGSAAGSLPFSNPNMDCNQFVRSMLLDATTPSTTEVMDNDQRKANPSVLVEKSTKVELFLQDINLQIGRVKKSLHLHVTDNQDVLMQRLSNVSLLFSDIKQVRAGVSMLQTSTSRIRREILTPLDDMRVQSKQLARVQQASLLLRRAGRLLRLSHSLRVEITRFSNVVVHEDGRLEEIQKTSSHEDGDGDGKDRGGQKQHHTQRLGSSEIALVNGVAPAEELSDLPKAASLVHDIEIMLDNETSLKEVVGPPVLLLVEQCSSFVKRRATEELTTAITHFDQSQVSRSLQVFFNLECLPEAVDNVLRGVIECITRSVVSSLDMRSIAREADKGVVTTTSSALAAATATTLSGVVGLNASDRKNPMPSNGRTKIWRRVLWGHFDDGVCEEIHKRSLQVWNLQRILYKKRDPITHMNFLELLKRDYNRQKEGGEKEGQGKEEGKEDNQRNNDKNEMGVVYGKYWMLMTRELSQTFLSTGRSFTFVKNILIREYPSFRERMESVLRRLLHSTESRAKLAHTTPIGGTRAEHEWMMRATRPFLKVYLSRSAARIQEALTLMGVATKKNGGSSSNSVGNYNLSVSLPSKKDISTYVECVRHELRFVRHDVELTNHVTKIIVSSINTVYKYFQTCHCNNPEIHNYDKTTYGAATIVSTTSSSHQTPSSTNNTTATKANNANNNTRKAGLNAFQKNNCTLAYRIHVLMVSIEQISNELVEEFRSSSTNMERAAMWCTEEDMLARSALLTNGCNVLNALKNRICGEFWSGLSFHFETMINQMHVEKYGHSSGSSNSHHSATSAWTLKMKTTVQVLETETAVAWMLASTSSSTSSPTSSPTSSSTSSSSSSPSFSSSSSSLPTNTEEINAMLRTVLVCRVVDSFCAHCSMVRPLSQQGRRMLLNDSSLLRSCLKRVHPSSKDDLYIELSMVEKHILLAGNSDDTKDDGDGDKVHEMRVFLDKCLQTCPSLRPSLCYNHVVAHGPPQLQLPHRRHGWSHARYIKCMEQGGKDDATTTTPTAIESNAHTSRFFKTPSLVRLSFHVPLSLQFSSHNRMDEMHQRLAHHITNEQACWDEILKSMDAYVQRLTVAKTSNKEPCVEYTLLEKYGMKYLSKYRTHLQLGVSRN